MSLYNIKVCDEHSTIKKLCEGYSIARYGDGELELVFNSGLSYFKSLLKGRVFRVFGNGGFLFCYRQKKILQSNIDRLLIGVPNVFEKGSDKKWKSQYWYNNLQRIASLLNEEQQYYSAFFTRANSKDPRFSTHWDDLQKLWQDKRIAIVNFNSNVCEHILFSNAKSIEFIQCRKRNAYGLGFRYRALLEKCKRTEAEIVLASVGPVSNLLAYDLTLVDRICIDIGQLVKTYDRLHGKDSDKFY